MNGDLFFFGRDKSGFKTGLTARLVLIFPRCFGLIEIGKSFKTCLPKLHPGLSYFFIISLIFNVLKFNGSEFRCF